MQIQRGHCNEFQFSEMFGIFASKNVYAYGSMKLFTNCVLRKSYQIDENRRTQLHKVLYPLFFDP